MARTLDGRLKKLEQPHGDQAPLIAAHLQLLRELCGIRGRLDAHYTVPTAAELRQEAARLAATGKTPAQVCMEALVQAWEEQDDP